ncbi:MAG: ribosome biogenesis GTP-binding protein YihA/YsxC [Eubacteriales bacterium]
MIIRKAEFVTSVKDPEKYENPNLPEIAISGKSNVGKSSLINFITNHSKLAYTSKKPGKTRLINFFNINGEFFLVDLPGYGFSKASKDETTDWQGMMEGYFKKSTQLKGILLLLDIRHDPSEDDLQMLHWAQYYSIPCAVLATKADKIAKSKRKNVVEHMKKILGVGEIPMSFVSAQLKVGKEEALAIMEKFLQ